MPQRWAPALAAMHYLKTLIQSRLQGTPFYTLSEAVSVTRLRRRLFFFFFLRAHGAEPEEGQVDKGDVGVDVLYRRAVSEGN